MKQTNHLPRCILALSWRDIQFPTMGGAEIYTHEMLKRVAAKGIEVVHFAPFCKNLKSDEIIDQVHYIRCGSLATVIFKARSYYKKRQNEIDFVIDQCNTFRFFTKYWVKKSKRIFLIFQLTREIWDINMPFPFNKIGKIMETPLLKMNRHDITVTESESTKKDLLEVGFQKDKVKVIPVGLHEDILNIPLDMETEKKPIFIFVGRYSKYKGIDTTVKAFGIIKQKYPEAKLWIVGKKDESFIETVLKPVCEDYRLTLGDQENSDVVTWGFVSESMKNELQSRAKALIFPSIREGWGMIISEAGALGTPSITYDAPGTRDAVDFGKAGYLCKENTTQAIVECMESVLTEETRYESIRKSAWVFSNQLSFNRTGEEFLQLLSSLMQEKSNKH